MLKQVENVKCKQIRWLSLLLAVVLCCSSLSALAVDEESIPGMDAFSSAAEPEPLPFTDVPENEYYYGPIQLLYSLGLVYGRIDTEFEPNSTLTMAECTALAVRIYELYYGLQTDFTAPAGSPWYQLYLEKAAEYDILPEERTSFTLKTWHDAKVLIIAGHGMKNSTTLDPGAIATVNGVTYREYKETRKLSELVVDALSDYAEAVYYPEARDAYSDCNAGVFYDQVDLTGVDYALVIHFNSYNYSSNGSLAMIPSKQSSSAVEENILQNMASLGFANRGIVRKDYVVPNTVLRKGVDCGLLETCFIDSASDMCRYTGDRQAVADAIALGIAKGLGLTD